MEKISNQWNVPLYKINVIIRKGWIYFLKEDYEEALQCFENAERMGNLLAKKNYQKHFKDALKIKAICLGNKGTVLQEMNDLQSALNCYFEAIKINLRLERKYALASNYSNIAMIYSKLKDYKNALKFIDKSLEINYSANFINDYCVSLINKGKYLYHLKNYAESEKILRNSYLISDSLKNYGNLSVICRFMGMLFEKSRNYDSATKYYRLQFEFSKKTKNQENIIEALLHMAEFYFNRNDMHKTKYYVELLNEVLKKQRINNYLRKNIYHIIHKYYYKTNQYKYALYFLDKYHDIKDSILNLENIRSASIFNAKSQYELNRIKDSISFQKEMNIKNLELKNKSLELDNKRKQQWGLLIILIILITFSYLLFNRFKIIRKQNRLISEQKNILHSKNELLEHKNKEILDSITYSKRIQNMFLSDKNILNNFFLKHALYYQPRDIVAGDFYWFMEKNGSIFIAIADCTGHGVPGALLSIFFSSTLQQLVSKENIEQTNEILNQTRELLINKSKLHNEIIYDGMDIALIKYTPSNNTLQYSGANRPIAIMNIHNKEIKELSPDKMPIGNYEKNDPFSATDLTLNDHEVIILFTDGMTDQFGGPKNKKIGKKNLFEFLISKINPDNNELEYEISAFMQDWMGNNEQTDDQTLLILFT
ncbi:MAG: SpoIIE family protein phosphatase [Bacteroidia bacterium]|nr:SpoIIE family protein phosphatase [Bacteroidia bacterium]